jgi:hypothetical protein
MLIKAHQYLKAAQFIGADVLFYMLELIIKSNLEKRDVPQSKT